MFGIARGGEVKVARWATLATVVVVAFATQGDAEPVKVPVGKTGETGKTEEGQAAEVERHHIRYDDGTMTINDFCPVLQRPLGPVKSPIFVNGRPMGFC
jgi:hypothetical protein